MLPSSMSLISFLIWMRASQNLEKIHQNWMKEWTRRVSVPVQLLLVLGLCGLNHQGASHRPAHCGRMEAEVHQPLGDVHRLHSRGLLEVAHVDDELVGNLWFNLRKRVPCTIILPGHPFLCEGFCSGP